MKTLMPAYNVECKGPIGRYSGRCAGPVQSIANHSAISRI